MNDNENKSHKGGLFSRCRNVERRPIGKKRLVSCAELVLDVDAKTQRVILKKKVVFYSSKIIRNQVWIKRQTRGPTQVLMWASFSLFRSKQAIML